MSTRHHPNRALSQKEMETRRLKAVPYFKKEWPERRIALKLGVSGPSVHDWKVRWKKHGEAGLRAGKYGPVSRLSPKKEKILRKKILEGAEAHGFPGDFWTLGRITSAVERWTKVHYQERSIWHVLRRLGFSCQKPIRRAVERNEKDIRTWTKEIWPGIKKGALKTV